MVEKIRDYLYAQDIIDDDNRLNVDFLGEEATEFAILPISIDPIIEKYINGETYCQFQFQLISRNYYGADVLQNMANNTFYEEFYETITKLNKQRILPNITGIDAIECLDNGAILNTTTNTAQYSIMMRIKYYK